MYYTIVAAISEWVREYKFSSPGDIFTGELMDMKWGPSSLQTVVAIALVAPIISSVVHKLTYNTVGIFYRKGSAPAIGSLLYLFLLWINNYVIENILCSLGVPWLLVFIVAGYLAVLVLACKVVDYIKRVVFEY